VQKWFIYAKTAPEGNGKIIHTSKYLLAACLSGFFAPACFAQLQVLVDHVGYETQAPKQAIVAGTKTDRPQKFMLIDTDTDKTALSGEVKPSGQVNAWDKWVFWIADFSSWK
jgi:hypothetical protein